MILLGGEKGGNLNFRRRLEVFEGSIDLKCSIGIKGGKIVFCLSPLNRTKFDI